MPPRIRYKEAFLLRLEVAPIKSANYARAQYVEVPGKKRGSSWMKVKSPLTPTLSPEAGERGPSLDHFQAKPPRAGFIF